MPPPRASGQQQTRGRTALLLRKAGECEDPSAAHPDLLAFTVGATSTADTTGVSVTAADGGDGPPAAWCMRVEHRTASTLGPQLHEWCFRLVKDALQQLYEPVWGWKDATKREQLTAAASRFLVIWARLDERLEGPYHAPALGGLQRSPSCQGPRSPDTQPLHDQVTVGRQAIESMEAPACPPQCRTAPPTTTDPTAAPSTSCTRTRDVAQTAGRPPPGQTSAPGVPRVVDDSGWEAAAYLCYRLEQGYFKDPVLYVYEVMVAPQWQRLGLASRLMRLAEAMAWELGMDAVVLTVLTANLAAKKLYDALGYSRDKASPGPDKGYEIRSKRNPAVAKTSGGGKGKR